MATKQTPKLNLTSFDRVPPHNLEAEQSLLGSILVSMEAVTDVVDLVKAEDFYSEAHQLIYEAVVKMSLAGEPIDAVTLSEKLKKMSVLERVGGKPYIYTLANMVPTAASVRHYGEIVARNATLRGLIKAAANIAAIGYEAPEDVAQAVDKAESLLFEVSNKRVSQTFVHIDSLLRESFEQLESNDGGLKGISTGFIDLDEKISGLHPSDLIIIAARPAMGKTSLALSIAQNAAMKDNKTVAVFSLEMSRHQLAQRLMCAEAKVDAQSLRTGKLSERDGPRLSEATNRLSRAPIYIDDTASITVMELRAKARRLAAHRGLDLIIVDYLQLMNGSGRAENRQQEISEISRALKILGRELNVPVIAVSQLSRAVETRSKDRRPILSDLRESGAIEQDADLVIFIYRDKYYNPESDDSDAEIIIAKHRNGPTGKIKLAFLEKFAKFDNLSRFEPEGNPDFD